MKSIEHANISPNTKVLIRADIDVPIKDGQIEDDFRLIQSLETIKYVLDKKAFPVICGHMGRPNGQIVPELSTALLKPFYDKHLGQGNYELLENLRFNPAEESNDPTFAKELAAKAQIYVNDAFATSTRDHVSFTGITAFLPSYAGLRLIKEVNTLEVALKHPDRPLVAIIGGAKIESKKPVINELSKKADTVLVGGRLGLEANPKDYKPNVIFPIDYAKDQKDIGDHTIKAFKEELLKAKTVIWAGPLGLFEETDFQKGTKEIGELITNHDIYTIIGGGDTLFAAKTLGFIDKINFVSCGGSAMLDFIAGETLPGLKALHYYD